MPNHVHILLKEENEGLSSVVKRISAAYALDVETLYITYFSIDPVERNNDSAALRIFFAKSLQPFQVFSHHLIHRLDLNGHTGISDEGHRGAWPYCALLCP